MDQELIETSTPQQCLECERLHYQYWRLTAAEWRILILRHGIGGEPQSLEQIGQRFGVTAEFIERLGRSGEKKIKSHFPELYPSSELKRAER